MRFIRKLLNLIYFVGLLLVTSVASFGVSWAVTAQTTEPGAEIRIWNDGSGYPSYQDAFTFWGTEIVENVKHEPKYRVRNWIRWDWWKDSVGYGIDYAVDKVVAVVSPVVVPLWNIDQVKEYYIEDYVYDGKDAKPFLSTLPYVEEKYSEEIDKIKGPGYTAAALAIFKTAVDTGSDSMSFGEWVDDNPLIYEKMFRVAKYNVGEDLENKAYAKYYDKFVDVDSATGMRNINVSVYILYLNIFFDLLFTIWIVHQYPIFSVTRNEYGEIQVDNIVANKYDRKKEIKARKKALKEEKRAKKANKDN